MTMEMKKNAAETVIRIVGRLDTITAPNLQNHHRRTGGYQTSSSGYEGVGVYLQRRPACPSGCPEENAEDRLHEGNGCLRRGYGCIGNDRFRRHFGDRVMEFAVKPSCFR